jgi:hypothetical protein
VEIGSESGCVVRASDRVPFCWRYYDQGEHTLNTMTRVWQMKAKELLPPDGTSSTARFGVKHLAISGGLACGVSTINIPACWGGQGAVFAVAGNTTVRGGSTARVWSSHYRPYLINNAPPRTTGLSFSGMFMRGPLDSLRNPATLGASATGYGLCILRSDNRVYCYGYNSSGVWQNAISGTPAEIPLTRVRTLSISP